MAEEGKRKSLGRGLSSLLGDEGDDYAELDKQRAYKQVPVEFLRPGRYQPRRKMKNEQIQDLANSIREKGILQPLLVRRMGDDPGVFEIIAGERRWRAAQLARLHDVPVIIKDFDDRQTLEVALVENLQREDLSPLEEAEGYARLTEEFSHTQEELARAVGKSRSNVANSMRLLGLPDPVKKILDDGLLSAGHARALLNAEDSTGLARKVVKGGLNVRQTEKLARAQGVPSRASRPLRQKDADTVALEKDLANILGLKVDINFKGESGSLTVHYSSLEQLDDILQRLGRTTEVPHGEHQPSGRSRGR